MKRTKVYTSVFSLLLLLGSSFFSEVQANNAQIEALLDHISDLEDQLDSLVKSKASAKAQRADANVQLRYLSESIAATTVYIAQAYDAYRTAANDEERANLAKVITDLQSYRQSLIYEYNSVMYTIQLLGEEIERFDMRITEIEKSLTEAYARLADLLN